jgi:uncharacterized membrane protein (DUF106 family)
MAGTGFQKRENNMGTHLDETVKACNKCLDEAKKLEKQFKAAKTPQDKDKLRKMAEASKKMAKLYFDAIEAAKVKDAKVMYEILKNMGV